MGLGRIDVTVFGGWNFGVIGGDVGPLPPHFCRLFSPITEWSF